MYEWQGTPPQPETRSGLLARRVPPLATASASMDHFLIVGARLCHRVEEHRGVADLHLEDTQVPGPKASLLS